MNKNILIIAGSIILSGVIIAGAIFFTNKSKKEPELSDIVNKITKDDHIKGSMDAPVKIIEYSDFECPFCKRFHFTINDLLKDPNYKEKVAWVYRHFPLDSLHPRLARKAALASECAREQGGNDAFWKYTDKYFELTPANDRAADNFVYDVATKAGLDADKIKSCVESGKYAAEVEKDFKNAVETGGSGTPWNIVITKSGKALPVSGAVPMDTLKQIIDFAFEN